MPQSLAKNWIHIIFSTKNRFPFLDNHELQQNMHSYISGICKHYGCSETVVGGTMDHVHLLINMPKTGSVTELVQTVKMSSSKWIKLRDDADIFLKKLNWQKGYGAFSVSHSKVHIVRQYILNQVIHHKKFSFEYELQKILDCHQVEYNIDYLWD